MKVFDEIARANGGSVHWHYHVDDTAKKHFFFWNEDEKVSPEEIKENGTVFIPLKLETMVITDGVNHPVWIFVLVEIKKGIGINAIYSNEGFNPIYVDGTPVEAADEMSATFILKKSQRLLG